MRLLQLTQHRSARVSAPAGHYAHRSGEQNTIELDQ